MDTVLAGLEAGAVEDSPRWDETPSNDNEQGLDVGDRPTPRLVHAQDLDEAIGC